MSYEFVEVSKDEIKQFKRDHEAFQKACTEVKEELALLASFFELSDIEKIGVARTLKEYPELRIKICAAQNNGLERVLNLEALKRFCGAETKKSSFFKFF